MDIVRFLRQNYPNLNINLQEAPSYVRCHINSEHRDIILVTYKCNDSSLTPKKQQQSDQTTLISEFELTGSPLKLDMAYDKLDETLVIDTSNFWSPEENLHEPLSVKEARKVVNLYNSKCYSMCLEDITPLWVVCDSQDTNKTVLLSSSSCKGYFIRGIVNYTDIVCVSNLCIESLKSNHCGVYGNNNIKEPSLTIEGIYRISGMHNRSINRNNVSNHSSLHNGMTELHCEWNKPTFQVPPHETSVKLIQEVIIGHSMSQCTILWKSVCAIQGIRNAILSLSNILIPNDLSDITIRPFTSQSWNSSQDNLENRLQDLLTEVENYTSLPQGPKGGCNFISDDTTNLKQVFKDFTEMGSSNDFTYKLWDILRDCDTVENLIYFFIRALKHVHKRNLRPFIDPGNTTFVAGLIKKLARGLSQQAVKSLSIFKSNPTRALNVIGQLGITKTCWEYTNIFSLIDNALAFNDRLKLQNKASDVDEDMLHQTVLDMTLGSGDVTINPFDSKFNLMDSTLTNEIDSSLHESFADVTLDNFASLKKHNIEVKTERRSLCKDQPLISDDTDIELTSKEWKFKLTRLAQLHVCIEHIFRSQTTLNLDFNTLKPILSQILDYYASEKSPIKTVDQLNNEPMQMFSVPVQYKIVKEHLQFKYATMYRVIFASDFYKDTKKEELPEIYQTIQSIFVFNQQPVFPPVILIPKEADISEINNILYHRTKYTFLNNRIP